MYVRRLNRIKGYQLQVILVPKAALGQFDCHSHLPWMSKHL